MNVHQKPEAAGKSATIPPQVQAHQPGIESAMRPKPDYAPKYPGVGKLKDKVAIITGGDSGIGRAVAVAMAREGALISILYLEEHDDADETIRLVEAEGGTAIKFAGDVGDEMVCWEAVERTFEEFGRVDILFNNAGIVTSGTAETTSEETWNKTLAINVTAVWRMSKLVLPHMRNQGSGVIVNNGSDWSVVAGRDAFSYITSKGAVAMMTKAMAIDYARENIRVNAVCPGDTLVDRWMETGYFEGSDPVDIEQEVKKASAYLPMGRFGKPEEIARAVLFLASEDSSFVTGHLLLVDGGNTAQ